MFIARKHRAVERARHRPESASCRACDDLFRSQAVGPLPVVAWGRVDAQAHFLFHRAAEEATDRVGLLGKILIPGVVSQATKVVEHPEVVADRIVR